MSFIYPALILLSLIACYITARSSINVVVKRIFMCFFVLIAFLMTVFIETDMMV